MKTIEQINSEILNCKKKLSKATNLKEIACNNRNEFNYNVHKKTCDILIIKIDTLEWVNGAKG